MTRLIDADDLMDWSEIVPLTEDGGIDINVFEEKLKSMPTIDAAPVKHGKWIWTEDKDDQYGYVYKCSVCGTSTIGDSERFCGWCGADMRGEDGKPPQVNPEMVKALLDRIEKQRGEE